MCTIVCLAARMWQYLRIMLQLVHSDALHFEQPIASYWEDSADPLTIPAMPLDCEETCDVAIIGAGFTGLNAALELAAHGVDVRVLEAGHIGWGASGRNGGFACFGSHKLSFSTLIERYGKDETRKYYRGMKEAIARVASNLEDYGIDAGKAGEGDLSLAHLPSRMDDLRAEKDMLEDLTGDPAVMFSKEELRQHGCSGPTFYGAMKHPNGFGLHPLNYVRGLARAAHERGIKLYPYSRMTSWEQSGGLHVLRTACGSLRAKRVIVATNGYTPENISQHHKGRILPAMSNIIVTRPLTEDERNEQGWTTHVMASDSRNLLHYFRLLPNNRFLFGGRGGTDSSMTGAAPYRAHITATFRTMFPVWASVDITHFWRGFVCLSYDKVPYVGSLDDSKTVWTALAYHGSGVAMGSFSGRAVARMMLDKKARDDVPAILTRRLAKFPLPLFRPLYLKGAYMWYGHKDKR
jgi:glycine/D-amino acid oxidase-like deaminating enzyme